MSSPFVGVPVDLGALIVQGLSNRRLSGQIPWHCLRIFFMRDTGSHREYSLFDRPCWTLCRRCLLLRIVSLWESGRVEVARQSWISAWGVRLSRIYMKLKKSQFFVIWRYLLTIMELYFSAYFKLEPMFSRPCCHHMGVKGMMMDRRDLNPSRWRSGLIVYHYATAATSHQLKSCNTFLT